MEVCTILRPGEAIHLSAIAVRFLICSLLSGPSVMNVNTKICKRLNDFDIVTSHRNTGARWKTGVDSLNLGLQPLEGGWL